MGCAVACKRLGTEDLTPEDAPPEKLGNWANASNKGVDIPPAESLGVLDVAPACVVCSNGTGADCMPERSSCRK